MSLKRKQIEIVSCGIEQIPDNKSNALYTYKALFPNSVYFNGLTELIIVEPWFSQPNYANNTKPIVECPIPGHSCDWQVFLNKYFAIYYIYIFRITYFSYGDSGNS